ncbi:MAG TPA: Sec-independent protein translocase protein TatB [Steroidobacteraceae bacterium]|nr:Sec-independent protein translocase protein TatB [Steroidobacteraceae bacterium]
MFEVGFTELLVIFVLALIVLGPEKLPRLAQQVGRWVGRARAMAKQFREQLEDEVNLADMKKWQETSSTSTYSTPSSQPESGTSAASTQPDATQGASPAGTGDSTTATPETSATPETAATLETAAPHDPMSPGHYAGPPPEPEADVYQPPRYAAAHASNGANGSASHEASADHAGAVESAPDPAHSHSTFSHEPVPASDDEPTRPGEVITHTHERGI